MCPHILKEGKSEGEDEDDEGVETPVRRQRSRYEDPYARGVGVLVRTLNPKP